ncbi:MAG: hypothetical protein JWP27_2909 [Flaviaesturariibacter sp.]|nr:hypothetical protein [Flaviaesturariibacter sp.]
MSAATVLVACNSNPDVQSVSKVNSISADTSGLAAFQAARQQQALASVALVEEAQAPVVAKAAAPRVRTVTHYVPVRAKASSAARTSSSSVAKASAPAPQVINSESSNAAKAKKGISKAAKGAIIGGIAGAAGGAIINKKNRVVGAVIGGVVGAAGGYGIGRGMDKKDGRSFVPPTYN